jgi:1-acyl-sn-glycerol-3-phosphate acyltransferase
VAYWVLKILLTPVLRTIFQVRSEGTNNVPKTGPVILASNHQSFVDSVFLSLVVRRRVTFVAKAEYFENPKTAWFFRAVGMIPLKRGDGPASARALAAAREVLAAGGVLGIYPEGTRSPDGRLYKGHTGAARLALDCHVPVVPVAQFGTAAVQPIGSMWPKLFRRVDVKMGRPLRWQGQVEESTEYREFTNRLMAAIASLSGQVRVDTYARRDKGRLAAPGSEAEPLQPNGPGVRAAPA